MTFHASHFIHEFRQIIEMLWWSFIKAPSALVAAWAFFSMLSNPAHVATQTMRVASSGALPTEMMTGVMTIWFLSAAGMFALSLFARSVFRIKIYQASDEVGQSGKRLSFHL